MYFYLEFRLLFSCAISVIYICLKIGHSARYRVYFSKNSRFQKVSASVDHFSVTRLSSNFNSRRLKHWSKFAEIFSFLANVKRSIGIIFLKKNSKNFQKIFKFSLLLTTFLALNQAENLKKFVSSTEECFLKFSAF